MSDLKDFKFDTSEYLNLPPLGIRNAVIEECAKVVDAQAAVLRDTAIRLGEVAADAVTISLHDQAAVELDNGAVSIRALKS